eukprot:CAMPEP_0168185886 /NCGR_PEP_ID=MMETSP0139_2-20121125/14103_1 /TAXON_ID=44445 /ORGANISM="Pseudo-nitzschia australis, Strain 10249 10 AB" /LENGTH=150 /DNA_ID=CAMNT_0008107787 /DNA_START=139 /DNA_END=591 /DNA_ORIENTATION=+
MTSSTTRNTTTTNNTPPTTTRMMFSFLMLVLLLPSTNAFGVAIRQHQQLQIRSHFLSQRIEIGRSTKGKRRSNSKNYMGMDDENNNTDQETFVSETQTTTTSATTNTKNNEAKDNFDGKGFANYLLPYVLALVGSVLATAAMFKFVLLDY